MNQICTITLIVFGSIAVGLAFDESVEGKESTFHVTYFQDPPVESRGPFLYALKKWADIFPCKVPLRVRMQMAKLPENTLAQTNNIFSITRANSQLTNLEDNTVYTPALAAATDSTTSFPDFFHLDVWINKEKPWYFDVHNAATPADKFDFVTVLLHELAHALFFNGAIRGDNSKRISSFQSQSEYPARFDQFIQNRDGTKVSSCSPNEIYDFMTHQGQLLFRTEQQIFSLYSPHNYTYSRSVYHFNAATLRHDCVRHGIDLDECSDLMTPDLELGYTQREIGVPTLLVMKTILGNSSGLIEATPAQCVSNAQVVETPTFGTLKTNTSQPEEEYVKPPSSARKSQGKPVCVSTAWLLERKLGSHILGTFGPASVLCIPGSNLPCATPGHVLRLKGELFSYKEICANYRRDCFASRMNVSQLSHSHDWDAYHFEDLHLTSLSISSCPISRFVAYVGYVLISKRLGHLNNRILFLYRDLQTSLPLLSILASSWLFYRLSRNKR